MQIRDWCVSFGLQDIGYRGERSVPIVTVEAVGCFRTSQVRGRHQEIDKRIIVKVPEERLDSEVFDLILLDYNMPGEDGFAVLSKLKNNVKFENMDELKKLSLMSKAKHVLYLIDACYGELQQLVRED